MTENSQRVEQLFRDARKAARLGHRGEARRLLWLALAIEPDRAELWIWLAGVASSARASMGYLGRALTLDPHNERAKAGLRWARRRVMAAPAPRPIPIAAPLTRPSRIKWWWVVSTLAVALAVMAIVGAVLFPDLTALAAGAPTTVATPIAPTEVAAGPTATSPVLATRTKELPPTWTNTPTVTPSPIPSLTPTPTATVTPSATPTAVPPSPTWVPTQLPAPVLPGNGGERWIDVNLSEQLLIAYEGDVPVYWVTVSTGLPGTPTVVGQYRIYVKYESTLMSGDNYYLPNVPYTMYFYRGYGIHGAYWHNNFGYPMSHGCVNVPVPDSEWLYNFAGVGTLVNIHY